jgi:hypothetical protein
MTGTVTMQVEIAFFSNRRPFESRMCSCGAERRMQEMEHRMSRVGRHDHMNKYAREIGEMLDRVLRTNVISA